MPSPDEVTKLLPLVREYGQLEKRRTTSGVTPGEYFRWSELRTLLESKFPQGERPTGAERRSTLRLPTRMLVEFRNEGELQGALIQNISRGGLFIATHFEPPVGTEMNVAIRVGENEVIELPVEVASTCVPGPGTELGIGCKFGKLDSAQQAIVDEMFATALDADTDADA